MDVILTSPWIPAEWIKAHGHEPRGVWFEQGYARARGGFGAGVCAFAGRVQRLAEEPGGAAMVFSTHCDQLRRAFDAVRSPAATPTFLFNFPATWQTSAARKLLSAELKRLGDFLVEIGGRAPEARALTRCLEQYRAARTELARAAEWCHGSNYAAAIAQFHRDGSFTLPPRPETTPARAPRLALVGGPLGRDYAQLIPEIEALGGVVALNATETGERTLAPLGPQPRTAAGPGENPSTERLVEQLAVCLLEECVDVFQRPNTRLYSWLGRRLQERKIDGIILWQYVGCDLWRAEAESLRETFQLPLLLLEADETGTSSNRSTGRVQAFLEALG